jgi:hypothetical protein
MFSRRSAGMTLKKRRLSFEENRMWQEIIAKESLIMMMDRNGLDEKAREYRDIKRYCRQQ